MLGRRCVALWVAVLATAGSCSTAGNKPASPPAALAVDPLRFDLSGIDRSADPCRDFYAYACGSWLASHPIPADKPRVSRYDEMIDRNEAWTREILERAADDRRARSPVEKQVGDDYASCLDQEAIDGRGRSPLAEDFAAIDAALRSANWTAIFARFAGQNVNAPFTVYADQDIRSPDEMMFWLNTGGLGLRDRDDYLRDDEHSRALRSAYRSHLRRVLTLLGESDERAQADAARVMAMETALARATPDVLTRRSRLAVYHPTSVEDLSKRAPGIDWPRYFRELGAPSTLRRVNVVAPPFVDAVQALIAEDDRSGWRAFLQWHLVQRATEVLPSPFAAADFDFFQKTARGVRQMAPRWRRCQKLVDEHLGEAVGQLFVKEHFPLDARGRVQSIIESIRGALGGDIAAASWMSDVTRREALGKLKAITVKIGHPDRWRDYSGLLLDRAQAYENAQRARRFEVRRQMAKLGAPTDRAEWDSLPQQLDGYSTKVLNEIAFTAGILQRPFFDPGADPPLQYGALGAVAGHELIHLFDDEGRKFDGRGAMRDWWTPEDARRYGELAQCFVGEYGREISVDDLRINGQLTLGENLADNGGLRLAYRASAPGIDGTLIDGFTPAQRFFLAWAQIRCENVTDAWMRERTRTDTHSPGRARVNVVVSNMPEFAAAFQCAADARMVRKDRCVLW
jgi:endothelin-converting enzyme/putative endopeptidase